MIRTIFSSLIILSLITVFSYSGWAYWKWASWRDQIEEDHMYYLKTSAPHEGIDYFVIKEEDWR